MAPIVSGEQISEFRERALPSSGVCFPTGWMCFARVDANMADPDPNARIYTGKDGGSRFFVDYCNWARIPEYKDFIFNSNAAAIGWN